MSWGKATWRCTKCQFDIFANKTQCAKCGMKRPEAAAPVKAPVAVEASDWICECTFANFRKRTACMRCHKPRPTEKDNTGDACCVCMVGKLDVLLQPCKHLCLCAACSEKIDDSCPICNGKIQSKEKIFMAGVQ